MKIVLTSFGSMGDVQPFLALAVELRKHGHEPLLAFSPNFANRILPLKLEFCPIGPELDPSLIRGVGTTLINIRDPAEQVRHFLNAVLSSTPQMLTELTRLCGNADALVSSPFQLASRMVYDRLHLPFISIHLSGFGALGNKNVKSVSAQMINQCRGEQGLFPLDDPLGSDGA